MNNLNEIIKIKPNPQLPKEIIDAYNNNKLIIFIGAGISRLMGCDGWVDMSNKLIESVFSPSESSLIVNSNLDQISKITIAKQKSIEANKEDKFWEIFEKSIKPKENNKDKSIEDVYDTICQLRTNYITTNCDGLLVEKFPYSSTINCTEETFVKYIDEPYVYCIHGDFKTNKEKLVFTIDQYLHNYRNNSDLVKFLKRAMSENMVLFLGYGLTEFQIMSAAFNDEQGIRHYLLDGFFDYEQDYVNALNLYYKQVGVQLIPYSKNINSYNQQIDIIKNWVDELRAKSAYSSRSIQSVITDINGFTDKNKADIKMLINRNSPNRPSCLKAFLNELPNCEIAKEWIEYLITNELVSLSDVCPLDTVSGFDSGMLWDFLNCLIYCHKNNKINFGDSKIIDDFITNFEKEICVNEAYYSNLNLVRQCAELLLERKVIPTKEEFELFIIYISTSYDNGYFEINNNIKNIKKWPTEMIVGIFQNIYAHENRNKFYYRYFDTYLIFKNHFNAKVINQLSSYVIKEIIEKEGKENYYHKSIEDRFHLSEDEYSFELKRIIEDISTNNLKRTVNKIIKTGKNTFSIQLCLHLLTMNNYNSLDILGFNPLNAYNTFVDFYYWLDKILSTLSNDAKNEICNMTVNASFGIKKSDNYYHDSIKRINTYRVMILKLINTQYSNNLINNYLDIYDQLLDPIAQVDAYYSVRMIENDTDFKDPIETEDAKEMLELVEDKINNLEFRSEHDEITILRNMFNKLNDKQKEKFLVFSTNSIEFLKILLILDKENIGTINKKLLKSFLNESIELISDNCYDNELTSEAIKSISNVIGFLHTMNWTPAEIITLSVKIIKSGILDKYIHSDSIDEIDIAIINDAECIIWNNILQSAQEIKENVAKIKSIKNIIKSKTNIYICYSLAYKINAIAYIDFDWFKDDILEMLKAQNNYKIDLLLTYNSRYITKELTTYLINSKNKCDVIRFINKDDKNNNYLRERYITYITSAYVFDHISLETFHSFYH